MASEDPAGDRSNSDDASEGGPEQREPSDSTEGPNLAGAGVVSVLGVELAGFLLVGVLGGNYLDEKLKTTPLFLLLGLFVALAAAGLQLWQFIRQFASGDDDDA